MATSAVEKKVFGYLPQDVPPWGAMISLGIQQVLTMFPATVLVAILDYQVAALVDLGLQDANIRYFQWNAYLGFAHGWFYSVFPASLHPQIWGLPRQFPMSQ